MQIWLPMAQEGDLKAQNYVGEIYEKGIGGTPQYRQAAEWYLKAAEKGFAAAQVNLGALYERGLGVEASQEKAAFWYRKASGLEAANIEFVPGVKQEDLQLLQRQRSDAEADRDNFRLEMEKLRKQLDDAQRQLRQQSKKSSSLQEELQKARSQQTATQAPTDNDRGSADDAVKLSAELKKQRANEARLIAEISSLEQQSAQLAGKLVSTVDAKDQELAATQQELEKLRQLFAVQQDIAQQKQARVAGLTKTLDQTREQSLALLSGKSQTEKQLVAEKASLEDALAEAQRSVAESVTKSVEKEQLVADLAKKLAEREASLKAELAKAQQQSAELQS